MNDRMSRLFFYFEPDVSYHQTDQMWLVGEPQRANTFSSYECAFNASLLGLLSHVVYILCQTHGA